MNHSYRKKPVVIEAFQMTLKRRQDNIDWPSWLHEAWNKPHGETGAVYPSKFPHSNGTDELVIHTLEGDHLVSFGDYIIRGVAGELYPCKPDIFEATYSPADEPAISITGFNRMECGVCEDITPFVVDDGTVACADCGVVHLFLTRVDAE